MNSATTYTALLEGWLARPGRQTGREGGRERGGEGVGGGLGDTCLISKK